MCGGRGLRGEWPHLQGDKVLHDRLIVPVDEVADGLDHAVLQMKGEVRRGSGKGCRAGQAQEGELHACCVLCAPAP